jgi:hypothetical protein
MPAGFIFSSPHFLMRVLMIALPGIFLLIEDAHAASATGGASAQIVRPLQVKSKSPLSFGELKCSSREGRVIVTPTDERIVTGSAKMEKGGYDPASFHVFGAPHFSYIVTTPGTLIFHVKGNKHGCRNGHDRDDKWGWGHGHDHHDDNHKDSSLLVKDFTTFSKNLNAGGHKGQLGNSGSDTLYVGGTLIVSRNAAPGLYRGYVPIEVAYQ